MKLENIFLIISIALFYYLINKFLELGGWNHQLLKILVQLILVLFWMLLMKYKNEIKEITEYDKYQKKIYDFFQKNGK